jgi:hypothetical protein
MNGHGDNEKHKNQSAKRKGEGGSRLVTNNEWDVGTGGLASQRKPLHIIA